MDLVIVRPIVAEHGVHGSAERLYRCANPCDACMEQPSTECSATIITPPACHGFWKGGDSVLTAVLVAFVLAAFFLVEFADADEGSQLHRVARPDWKSIDTTGVFYDDAFVDGLLGSRPEYFGRVSVAAGPGALNQADLPARPIDSFQWSQLISASSLEDLVKSLRFELDKSIVHPAQFAGGGHRIARRQFATLTSLFAIVHEYDGDVRWKKDAAAARDRCRQAAQASKTGSVQAFQAAKITRSEIADLVGGNPLSPGVKTKPNDWGGLVDRSSLMQQLDLSFREVIQPTTARVDSFRKSQALLKMHAELSAAIAEILTREGMEDAGDDEYDGYCRRVLQASREIVEAIEKNSLDTARTSAGEINKACSECHESYRG